MKAIILAAGLGTRLKPITNKTPKCLVPIKNKPLLEIWFDKLINEGFTEILINTHYLSNEVESFVMSYQNKLSKKIDIFISYEEELLGTAGTVWNNQSFFKNKNCVIINGDILTNFNIKKLFKFHLEKKYILTLSYIKNSNPIDCGIMELNNISEVTKFEEKPKVPFSNKVYSGIQVINYKIFENLPFAERKKEKYINLSFGDIWPKLIGDMCAYKISENLIDIGDIKSYNKANDIYDNFF